MKKHRQIKSYRSLLWVYPWEKDEVSRNIWDKLGRLEANPEYLISYESLCVYRGMDYEEA